MAHMEDYLQGLYEDEGLTDELEDEVAQTLLAWAEGEYTRLIDTHSDEDELEGKLKQVRRAMKAVNGLIGERSDGDEEALQEKITRFVNTLAELGHMIPDEAVETLRQQHTQLDPATLVQRLTTLHHPQDGASAQAIDQPDEPLA
ncbi:MAG: hypothetical protein ACOYLB_15500 [Phototrophicaceae bacterium]